MNPQTPTPPEDTDYTQPVAYDAEGRPLYAHPPTPPVTVQPEVAVHVAPQVVQAVRPIEPPKQILSEEAKARHEASQKKFPNVNLSEGEYVIRAMHRHPIGLFIPMALGTVLLTAATLFLTNYDLVAEYFELQGAAANPLSIILPVVLFMGLVGLGMYVAYYVYYSNKFYLTNESVIQEIQHSLFSKHEQTVSLGSIEDASYKQKNLIEHIFHYGSVRLSTEGDETTYKFTYVANPKEHIAVLNNAVESFKLGRPVHIPPEE